LKKKSESLATLAIEGEIRAKNYDVIETKTQGGFVEESSGSTESNSLFL
jgi:hypothetical protein